MFYRAKNVTIIPLMDPKRQMIIVPKSQVDEEAKKSNASLSQIVRSLMKGIKLSNIEKFEQALLPSFRLKDASQELPRAMSHIKISERDDGAQIKGGLQSSEISLVSGTRPLIGSLAWDEDANGSREEQSAQGIVIREKTIIVKDEFVFAVND